ncbi:MAG: sigma-70 family RNA polymerase sigma factor, partial [Saprospiraceae bacterium]|nr:sigma-70 family RNA polymerase sigma factor [Saprospiraceae bacterium]
GVIKNIVKDEALAADALQDTFVKYWQKGDQYDPEKSRLFTWLLRIARNTAIDKYRSISRRGEKEIQTADSLVHIGGSKSPDMSLLDMRDKVGSLEEKYQQVIRVLFFEGMTQKEASENLSIPIGTVKTRLRFALKELRKIFQERTIPSLITILLWI